METKVKQVIDPIPGPVREGIAHMLEERIGSSVLLHHFSFVSGGCINHGGKLRTSAGEFFLKWNDAGSYPDMFEVEAHGLKLLSYPMAIDIPEVIGYGERSSFQFLLLEFIEGSSPNKTYWQDLGAQLAALHRKKGENFGLDHDNYIGSLPQFNSQKSSWTDFFIEQRLQVQLKRSIDSGLADVTLARKFENLFKRLPTLLVKEQPSLLHGDLWSGNILTNESGGPCIIDPAVYYGHREVDLAMTQLFGGFDHEFYESYNDAFPLEPNCQERFSIYNLYPLMVHVNLFGNSYLRQVNLILDGFL